jgi:hypothetical protein
MLAKSTRVALVISLLGAVSSALTVVPAVADGMHAPKRRVVKHHTVVLKRHPTVHNAWGYPATSLDPYAYSYEPRPWYPYYNSAQWVPSYAMRYRSRYDYALPPYYASWGYPIRCRGKSAVLCDNPGDRHW